MGRAKEPCVEIKVFTPKLLEEARKIKRAVTSLQGAAEAGERCRRLEQPGIHFHKVLATTIPS